MTKELDRDTYDVLLASMLAATMETKEALENLEAAHKKHKHEAKVMHNNLLITGMELHQADKKTQDNLRSVYDYVDGLNKRINDIEHAIQRLIQSFGQPTSLPSDYGNRENIVVAHFKHSVQFPDTWGARFPETDNE